AGRNRRSLDPPAAAVPALGQRRRLAGGGRAVPDGDAGARRRARRPDQAAGDRGTHPGGDGLPVPAPAAPARGHRAAEVAGRVVASAGGAGGWRAAPHPGGHRAGWTGPGWGSPVAPGTRAPPLPRALTSATSTPHSYCPR